MYSFVNTKSDLSKEKENNKKKKNKESKIKIIMKRVVCKGPKNGNQLKKRSDKGMRGCERVNFKETSERDEMNVSRASKLHLKLK